MPLKSGTSKKTFRYNVKQEINAGRSKRQALAVAYSKQRKSKKNKRRGQ